MTQQNQLVSMNVRVNVGNRTFSISATDSAINYRDLTGSRTGKYVTEKQAKMLGKIASAVTGTVTKLQLPTEAAPKATKGAKGAKASAGGKARTKGA